MKRLSLAAAGFVVAISAGLAQEPAAPSPLTGSMTVDGLACPFCAFGLKKRLDEVAFLEDARIRVDAGRVDFEVKPGARPDVAALREAVRRAGFTPRDVVLAAHGEVRESGRLLDVGGGVTLLLDPGDHARELAELPPKAMVHVEGPAEPVEGAIRVRVEILRVQEGAP